MLFANDSHLKLKQSTKGRHNRLIELFFFLLSFGINSAHSRSHQVKITHNYWLYVIMWYLKMMWCVCTHARLVYKKALSLCLALYLCSHVHESVAHITTSSAVFIRLWPILTSLIFVTVRAFRLDGLCCIFVQFIRFKWRKLVVVFIF